MQETWLAKEGERSNLGKLDKEYKWTAKAAIREKKRGRAKGGGNSGGQKGGGV